MKGNNTVFESAFVQSDTTKENNTKPVKEEKVANTETLNTTDDLSRIWRILAGGKHTP